MRRYHHMYIFIIMIMLLVIIVYIYMLVIRAISHMIVIADITLWIRFIRLNFSNEYYLNTWSANSQFVWVTLCLSLFFPMPPLDPPEKIRKPNIYPLIRTRKYVFQNLFPRIYLLLWLHLKTLENLATLGRNGWKWRD